MYLLQNWKYHLLHDNRRQRFLQILPSLHLINRDNDDFSWVTKAFDESEGKRTYSDDIDKSSLNIIAENIENFLYNFK